MDGLLCIACSCHDRRPTQRQRYCQIGNGTRSPSPADILLCKRIYFKYLRAQLSCPKWPYGQNCTQNIFCPRKMKLRLWGLSWGINGVKFTRNPIIMLAFSDEFVLSSNRLPYLKLVNRFAIITFVKHILGNSHVTFSNLHGNLKFSPIHTKHGAKWFH